MSSRKERAKHNQESEEISHFILLLLTENKGYKKNSPKRSTVIDKLKIT